MDIKELALKINAKASPICDNCKGKPDYLYFNDKTEEVLAVICKPCQDAFEATIISIGKAFSSASSSPAS